jgi:hypothetical protein
MIFEMEIVMVCLGKYYYTPGHGCNSKSYLKRAKEINILPLISKIIIIIIRFQIKWLQNGVCSTKNEITVIVFTFRQFDLGKFCHSSTISNH